MSTLARSGSMEYLSVTEFFQDRAVLVTGGTGFMGKILVEKLLRSCPGIRNIYLLMRPKKNQDINTRLAELLNTPLFDNLRNEKPLELNKIVPILGDINEVELGISQTDQNLLIHSVSVVFHSAAIVRFDEVLKVSVTSNMLGTKRLIQLCHKMLGLEALIHVSTAYCNCDRSEVNEIVYPPPYDPEKIIQLVEWLDDDIIMSITPKLVGNRPNTYTFTKALAEDMLMKEGGSLPVAIVRPSIVLSSLREPMAGWVDNWNGPTGLIAAAGKGFFRTMWIERDATADLVPVDIVINLMIVAAWRTATSKSDEIRVYNCCTGEQNPISWQDFIYGCLHYLQKNPLGSIYWYPSGYCTGSWVVNRLTSLSFHLIPAHLLDTVLRLTGKTPFLVRIQQRLQKASKCLEFFTRQEWRFTDDNVRQLNTSLSSEDRKTFQFDVREINWPTYLEDYCLGIRKFVFKEPPSSLPAARRRLNRFYLLHRLTQLATFVIIWRAIFMRSSHVKRLWLFMVDIVMRMFRMIPYI